MVEFAILAPLLFMLVFGVVDFSRYLIAQTSVNSVSREAARYGSSVGDSGSGTPRYAACDNIRSAGLVGSIAVRVDISDIDVAYDAGPGTAPLGVCPAGGSAPTGLTRGDRVVVTTTIDFTFVTPIVGDLFGPTQVSSSDRRTIFR